jgi:hypothetical protein
MRRRLFGILAAVSLALALAAAALWVRSYSGTDYLQRSTSGPNQPFAFTHTIRGINWTHGEVRLVQGAVTNYPPPSMVAAANNPEAPQAHWWGWGRLGKRHLFWETPAPQSWWNRLGFYAAQTGWESSFASESQEWVAMPAWLPVLAFLILPVVWILRWRAARRRASAGLCETCGYDLRGTPERCPECGTVPKRRLNRGLT